MDKILDWGLFNFNVDRDRFECGHCDVTAEDEDEMIRHINVHAKPSPFGVTREEASEQF